MRLPTRDATGSRLVGLEKVRIYYVPLGYARPAPEVVLARGQVVLERSRPNLPDPGEAVQMDLHQIGRPAGWVVAVARAGGGRDGSAQRAPALAGSEFLVAVGQFIGLRPLMIGVSFLQACVN